MSSKKYEAADILQDLAYTLNIQYKAYIALYPNLTKRDEKGNPRFTLRVSLNVLNKLEKMIKEEGLRVKEGVEYNPLRSTLFGFPLEIVVERDDVFQLVPTIHTHVFKDTDKAILRLNKF
jgi:hypothetical protein